MPATRTGRPEVSLRQLGRTRLKDDARISSSATKWSSQYVLRGGSWKEACARRRRRLLRIRSLVARGRAQEKGRKSSDAREDAAPRSSRRPSNDVALALEPALTGAYERRRRDLCVRRCSGVPSLPRLVPGIADPGSPSWMGMPACKRDHPHSHQDGVAACAARVRRRPSAAFGNDVAPPLSGSWIYSTTSKPLLRRAVIPKIVVRRVLLALLVPYHLQLLRITVRRE